MNEDRWWRSVTPGELVAIEAAEPGVSAVFVNASDGYTVRLLEQYDVVGWADWCFPGAPESVRMGLYQMQVSPSLSARLPGPDLTNVPAWEDLDGLSFVEIDPCFVAYAYPDTPPLGVYQDCYEHRAHWNADDRARRAAAKQRRALYGPDGWYSEGDQRGIRAWSKEARAWQAAIRRSDPLLQAARQPIDPWLRAKVLKRCDFRCVYCGAAPTGPGMHLDHFKPVAHGGLTTLENLLAACQPCNSRKHDRIPACPTCGTLLTVAVAEGVTFRCDPCGVQLAPSAFPWVRS